MATDPQSRRRIYKTWQQKEAVIRWKQYADPINAKIIKDRSKWY